MVEILVLGLDGVFKHISHPLVGEEKCLFSRGMALQMHPTLHAGELGGVCAP